jgi:hypothetical protein
VNMGCYFDLRRGNVLDLRSYQHLVINFKVSLYLFPICEIRIRTFQWKISQEPLEKSKNTTKRTLEEFLFFPHFDLRGYLLEKLSVL